MAFDIAAAARAVPEYGDALVALLYQFADDELVMGHRDSEWLGLGPHIEEDVAFASIAQDEVGHATLAFRFLEELGEGKADDLAFLRPPAARRNAVLLEQPNGEGTYRHEPRYDWAYALVRHLAYDRFDSARLAALAHSSYLPLAQVAVKIQREEHYHLLHHRTWLRKLAQGGPEPRQRLQQALVRVWSEVDGLFNLGPAAGAIAAHGILPATAGALRTAWTEQMQAELVAADLPWPGAPAPAVLDGRAGEHGAALADLLDVMSEVYRTAPGARW